MIIPFLVALAGLPQSAPDSALALSQAKELIHQYYVTGKTPLQEAECHGRGLGECMEGDWSCVDFVCPTGLAGRRADLMARMEGLAPSAGNSEWMFRQRVALAVKAGELSRAAAIAGSCSGDEWWCQTLRGFTRHLLSPGDGAAHFDSAFAILKLHPQTLPDGSYAWSLGPDARCTWTNPRAAAPVDLLPDARRWSCEDDADEWKRFWWLADPLWSRPGNERYLEHLSRRVMIRVALDVLEDSRSGEEAWTSRYDDDLGEPYAIALRQGFPNSRRPLVNPIGSGRQGYATRGTAPHVEGGYSFAPDAARFRSPVVSTAEDWAVEWQGAGCASPWTERAHESAGWDEDTWLGQTESLEACGQERYIPAETWHNLLEFQTALFRRNGQLLVVTAALLPRELGPAEGLRPALVLGRVDDLSLRTTPAELDVLRTLRARALVPDSGDYLASIEVVGPGHVGRARAGTQTPALVDGFGVSDLALVRTDFEADRIPLEEALLPSLDIPEGISAGVYLEVYGLEPGEGPGFSLRVERAGGGILHRLGRFLRLTSDPEPLEVRWEESSGGDEELRRVFFALDVENLGRGDYRLSVSVHREDGREARTERRVTIG